MSNQPENVHVISLALQDFMLACEAKLLSPHTIDFYKWMLIPFIGWLGNRDLSTKEIRAYLIHRSQHVSPGTVHAHARAIRAFTRFLHREGWIEALVHIDMPRVEQKPVKVLTTSQIKRIIAECNKRRDRALILIMLDTGARRGEIISIYWADIDFQAGTILIRKSKSKQSRVVPIGVKARRTLLAWKRVSSDPRVFPLTASGLRMALWRIGVVDDGDSGFSGDGGGDQIVYYFF